MRCHACEGRNRDGAARRPPARQSGVRTCEDCGAVILTVRGVTVGAGNETLAQLAQFGLAVTGKPLLELRRQGT
jgi:hypothetical protein